MITMMETDYQYHVNVHHPNLCCYLYPLYSCLLLGLLKMIHLEMIHDDGGIFPFHVILRKIEVTCTPFLVSFERASVKGFLLFQLLQHLAQHLKKIPENPENDKTLQGSEWYYFFLLFPTSSSTPPQPDTRQASSSQHEDDHNDGDRLPISCFMKTHIDGSNFSLSNQCEYRIRIHPHQMTCVTEQSVHHLLTNIQISNMNNFCMFLQINSEDRIHKEFKLYTQGFIYPSYSGKLYVKVKNLSTFTKVLHPCDIVGYLVIQPFILREDNHHQQHTCARSML